MAKKYVPTTLDQYIAESLDEGLFDKENFKKIGTAIKQSVGILTDEQAKAKGLQIVKAHPAKLAAYNSWKTRRPDIAEKLLIFIGNHPTEPYFDWDGKKWSSTGVKSSASGLQGPSSTPTTNKGAGKYDKDGNPIKESTTKRNAINEAARMGSSSWKSILQDIDDYYSGPGLWDVDMKARTAKQYFYKGECGGDEGDEDEERVLVMSCPRYNEYINVELFDGDGNLLDSNEWDAEGLSAGEITSDAFHEVDCEL